MKLVKVVDNLGKFGRQFNGAEFDTAVGNNAREMALDMVRDALLQEAVAAIESTPEFQYEPLREQLLNNLQDVRHYKINSDATSIEIFDESVGGTVGDLVEGQQAAWDGAGGTQVQRLFCWTYGIYKPSMEGLERREKFEDYPTYQAIIEIRLQTWGDKAPYWRFLEWGNVGGDPAYPSFSGTGFIERTRARAQEILRTARAMAEDDLNSQLEIAVDEQLNRPDDVVNVSITRTTFGRVASGLVQVEQRVSSGGIWYMLVVGGRYTGRIQPGAALPTGEVFR